MGLQATAAMRIAHFICFTSSSLCSWAFADDCTSCAQITEGADESSLLHLHTVGHLPHVHQGHASGDVASQELPSPWDQFADKAAEALIDEEGRVVALTQHKVSATAGAEEASEWLDSSRASPKVVLPEHLGHWANSLRDFERSQPNAADRPPIEDVAGAGAPVAQVPQGFNLWSFLFPGSGGVSQAHVGAVVKFLTAIAAYGALEVL